MKTELQKQRDREYSRKYYYLHRKEILAKQKVRNKAKKVVKDTLSIHQIPTSPLIVRSNVQEMHINDFYSVQLARIEKVLWWICFAISFVGVAVLFK